MLYILDTLYMYLKLYMFSPPPFFHIYFLLFLSPPSLSPSISPSLPPSLSPFLPPSSSFSPSLPLPLSLPFSLLLAEIHVDQYYPTFLNMAKALMEGNIDCSSYEDTCWEMFGVHAYVVFTVDRLVQNIVRQVR